MSKSKFTVVSMLNCYSFIINYCIIITLLLPTPVCDFIMNKFNLQVIIIVALNNDIL